MSRPWRRTLLHSAVVVLIAILAGVVHVFIENDLRLPDTILRILPKIGLYPSVLLSIDLAYLLLSLLALLSQPLCSCLERDSSSPYPTWR
jgi:hypothetical protein